MNNTLILSIFLIFFGCATNTLKEKTPQEKKAELYYNHGTNFLVQKDYTSALDYLLKSLAIESDDTKTHNNLGMTYFFKKENEKAIKHLLKALDIDENNSDARNNLASVYTHLGRYEEAKTQYHLVLKNLVYQHQYRTYYNLGLIDQKAGLEDRAVQFFQKSIQENQSYCPAYYQLGMVSNKRFQYHQAVEYFRKASLGTCVDNPAPQYQQALSLINLGDHQKALHKLKEIIDQFPSSHYTILATRKLKVIKINKFRKETELAKRFKKL